MPERLSGTKLHFVDSLAKLQNLEAWVQAGPMQTGRIALDTETTGLSPEKDKVRLFQVGDQKQGWALPWDWWSGWLRDFLQRYQGVWYLHNAPFDYAMINAMGVKLDKTKIKDTAVMAHLREPHMPRGLKSQATRHVDIRAGQSQKALDEAVAKLGWAEIPLTFGPYWQYAALDPVLTLNLADVHEPHVDPIGFDIENSVHWVLENMMRRGVYVDVPYAREQKEKIDQFCRDVEQWCKDTYQVSPGSNLGVIKVLEEEGFTFTKQTKSGALSLDKEILGEIDHPLAEAVLRRRKLQKIQSTYLDFYIEKSVDSIIHPSINSLGARTGRKSSSSPNFQNLPRTSEKDSAARIVRNTVRSRLAHILVFADFSQIETRILAHLSEDEGLRNAFRGNDDFFVVLSQSVFQDLTLDKDSWQRNVIKTLVYAKIYGAQLNKLSQTLKMSVERTREIDNGLFNSFPGIKRFEQKIAQEAAINKSRTGEAFVVCPLSGRRHVAEPGREYALVNYMIQGMAAVFFKKKLLELAATELSDWMILPVHDEIILDVPIERAEYCIGILQSVMNDDESFSIPIRAEVSYGVRWGSKFKFTTIEELHENYINLTR